MTTLAQIGTTFFVHPALAILHLRARRSLVTLEAIAAVRQLQMQEEAQLAQEHARMVRDGAESNARLNAQLGVLGIAPERSSPSPVGGPAASPWRTFGDLLAALLVYRCDPPAGPQLVKAAEDILLNRVAPALAQRLALEEGHPFARPPQDVFGVTQQHMTMIAAAAALALPRARIGAVLASAGTPPEGGVEASEQQPDQPTYFPAHGLFTFVSPWPWIGMDMLWLGIPTARLQHSQARHGGSLFGAIQSLAGQASDGPACLHAMVVANGPFDAQALNRAYEAMLSQATLGLRATRGAPAVQDTELAGERGVVLEYRWSRVLIAQFERRYLIPVAKEPFGVVLSWECPPADVPRWSRDVDDIARSLRFGGKAPQRVRPAADASTGVPAVDRALRGAWLYDIGQGSLAEARAAADEALARQPTSRRARFAGAVVSAVAGDFNVALARLEELWPVLDQDQRRLVASFGLRSRLWSSGLRADGSLWTDPATDGGENRWTGRFGEVIGATALDLVETFLVRVGVTAAARATMDAQTEAEVAKAGLATPALLAELDESAAQARGAGQTQAAAYLGSVAARILANAGRASEALARLKELGDAAERAGDLVMCAWCQMTWGDLRLASHHRNTARRTGAVIPLLAALPTGEDEVACADARAAYELSVTRYRKAGAPRGAVLVGCRLAALDAVLGRFEQALSALANAQREASDLQDRTLVRNAAMMTVWVSAQRGAPESMLRGDAERLSEQARKDGALGWALSWGGVFRDIGKARRDTHGDVEAQLTAALIASALYQAAGADARFAESVISRIEALSLLEAWAEAAAEVESALSSIEERLAQRPDALELWAMLAQLALQAQNVYQGLRDPAMARRVVERLRALMGHLPQVDTAAILDLLRMGPAEAIQAGKGAALMAGMEQIPLVAARESALFAGKVALFHAELLQGQGAAEEGRSAEASTAFAAARAAAQDLGCEKDFYLAMCAALAKDREQVIAASARYIDAGAPQEPREIMAVLEALRGPIGQDGASAGQGPTRALAFATRLLETVNAWHEAAAMLARFDAAPTEGKQAPTLLASAEWALTRARIAEGLGDTAAAEAQYRAAAATFERARGSQRSERLRRALSAQRLFVDMYASWALFCAAQGQWDTAFELADRVRARSLAEGVAVGADTSSETPAQTELRARVERLHTELLYARARAPKQVRTIEIALQEANRVLQDTATSGAAAGAAAPPGGRLADVARSLDDGTLLLAYLYHRGTLLVWAITRKGLVRTHTVTEVAGAPFEARPFGARLRRVTAQLSVLRPTDAQRRASSGELSALARLLIDPVRAEIEAARRVIFIPHAELTTFPFAALPAGELALGLQKPLTVVHAASLLARGSSTPKAATSLAETADDRTRVLVVGNPSDMAIERRAAGTTTALEPLPGAEEEARRVAALYEATPLLGKAATRAEVVRRLGGSPSPRVVHLATHGVLDPEIPLASSVALSGGEVLSADAWAGLRTSADVVVLSACSTAGGQLQGGEIMGLTRMILLSGARAVVVSLWPVHDGLTAELMIALHQALGAGASVEEAVMRAGVHLAASPTAGNTHRGVNGAMDAAREVGARGSEEGMLDPAWPACWAPFIVVRASA